MTLSTLELLLYGAGLLLGGGTLPALLARLRGGPQPAPTPPAVPKIDLAHIALLLAQYFLPGLFGGAAPAQPAPPTAPTPGQPAPDAILPRLLDTTRLALDRVRDLLQRQQPPASPAA